MSPFIRCGIYNLAEVLPYIQVDLGKNSKDRLADPKAYKYYGDKKVWMARKRYKVFVESTVCCTCGMEGEFFALEQQKEKKETKEELLSCEGIRVLVVDDSPPNQVLMQAYFSELKCEGDFVNNGQEAIDKLKIKTNKYNLCLMDLHMPVLGGVETTKIIRKEINKNIPIIALTAAVLKEDRKKAKAAGMNDFLSKPIDIVKMAEKIIQYGKS